MIDTLVLMTIALLFLIEVPLALHIFTLLYSSPVLREEFAGDFDFIPRLSLFQTKNIINITILCRASMI